MILDFPELLRFHFGARQWASGLNENPKQIQNPVKSQFGPKFDFYCEFRVVTLWSCSTHVYLKSTKYELQTPSADGRTQNRGFCVLPSVVGTVGFHCIWLTNRTCKIPGYQSQDHQDGSSDRLRPFTSVLQAYRRVFCTILKENGHWEAFQIQC